MKKKFLLALIIPLFAVGLIIASDSAVEFRSDLNEAKKEASRKGKLCIVEFMTEHCYPCQMMDEITFTNKRVVDYIEEHYIPVKINIKSFDGFVWKEKYDISVVPTIMVFNSQGEPIAKYEESIGSQKMYKILSEHKAPTNLTNYNPASSSPVEVSPEPTSTYTPPVPTPPTDNGIDNQVTGLFEFKVTRAARRGYGVQVGVYAQYGNVLQAVEQYERQYKRPILVNINTLNGTVVYKVIVGGFASHVEANDFKRQISTSNTDYFIIDLAQF